jgi:nitroreductase
MTDIVHATALALAIDADGPLFGALLLGPSGIGKTTLAIAAIEACPWRRTLLVCDDAPVLSARGGRIFAAAPDQLKGLAELRGFGPVRIRTAPEIEILAAFDLGGDASRIQEPQAVQLVPGAPIKVWALRAGAGAAERLRLAARSLASGQVR